MMSILYVHKTFQLVPVIFAVPFRFIKIGSWTSFKTCYAYYHQSAFLFLCKARKLYLCSAHWPIQLLTQSGYFKSSFLFPWNKFPRTEYCYFITLSKLNITGISKIPKDLCSKITDMIYIRFNYILETSLLELYTKFPESAS